jgi:hypothetical protein
MATYTDVRTVDDLDGSGDAETVEFSFDGKDYRIDLSKPNLIRLEEVLDPFITKARVVGRSGGRARRRSSAPEAPRSTSKRQESQELREWARANGYQVSDRGRVSRSIKDAYAAAH